MTNHAVVGTGRTPRLGAAILAACDALRDDPCVPETLVLQPPGWHENQGFGRTPKKTAYQIRHDPNREKTAEDLRNMEAARLRREKRKARRAR